MSDSFFVTTPIYYVNGDPHIGHTYTTVLADSLVRYRRLLGDEAFLLTGTDEHGEKILEVATARGKTPKALADEISGRFQAAWAHLGLEFDAFVRTTDPDHVRVVRDILGRVHDAGQIEFREYEGLYCVGCERFLTERDMTDGLCNDHEREPEQRTESNYFFKMSEHFSWLVGYIEEHEDFIRPERYRNEVLSMLRDESGLGDLCISRPKSRLDWGIELPFDDGYVCYVWFDALISYISGAGYPDDDAFAARWAAAEHLIGKDILKPHGVFWPVMLRAIGLPPPRHLNVHGYWNVDDRKVSKSLGNMISPLIMDERYGFEAFRYFLLREMSFGVDANFSEAALVNRINADLANNLGNLVSRTLNMTARFAEGRVPRPGDTDDTEQRVVDALAAAVEALADHMPRLEVHRALEAILRAVDEANRYLEHRQPWKAAKEPGNEALVATALYTCCEVLRIVAILLSPFLPKKSAEILARLGLPEGLADVRLPESARFGQIPVGNETTKGAALFPRHELPESEAADAEGG